RKCTSEPSSCMSISPDITTAKSIESVRWLRGETPGPKETTRNTQPFAKVVPTLRVALSASPELSTGNPSVVQMTQASAPGRLEATFLETSSIITLARPLASWPVTTLRTCSAIDPLLVATRCCLYPSPE